MNPVSLFLFSFFSLFLQLRFWHCSWKWLTVFTYCFFLYFIQAFLNSSMPLNKNKKVKEPHNCVDDGSNLISNWMLYTEKMSDGSAEAIWTPLIRDLLLFTDFHSLFHYQAQILLHAASLGNFFILSLFLFLQKDIFKLTCFFFSLWILPPLAAVHSLLECKHFPL